MAKLLDSGESHITTRVMGTFGYVKCFAIYFTDIFERLHEWKLTPVVNFSYVAPEYANTGLLNEKSDIYSFGVLLLEAVTGRDPVDYSRPANEV